mmetsp:Transcript_46660/g.143890  ORF Transcript_46660/g.143890 Transcript_46660/m.143890 type:complete len:235 (-) Transcript_46660:309-1013(-)
MPHVVNESVDEAGPRAVVIRLGATRPRHRLRKETELHPQVPENGFLRCMCLHVLEPLITPSPFGLQHAFPQTSGDVRRNATRCRLLHEGEEEAVKRCEGGRRNGEPFVLFFRLDGALLETRGVGHKEPHAASHEVFSAHSPGSLATIEQVNEEQYSDFADAQTRRHELDSSGVDVSVIVRSSHTFVEENVERGDRVLDADEEGAVKVGRRRSAQACSLFFSMSQRVVDGRPAVA